MTRPCLGVQLVGPEVSSTAVNWRLFVERKEWTGPDECPPGHAVLVSGRVLVRFESPAAPFVSPPMRDLTAPNKAMDVKLAISDCDQSGEIVIDSDQSLVLPAEKVAVRVLTPSTWTAVEPPLASGNWFVTLKVRICPAPACCPVEEPILTEKHTLAPDTNLDLTIPRSARTLAISDGLAITVVQWWKGIPGVGTLIATTTYAAQGLEPIIPGCTHVRVVAVPALTRLYAIRWEISP